MSGIIQHWCWCGAGVVGSVEDQEIINAWLTAHLALPPALPDMQHAASTLTPLGLPTGVPREHAITGEKPMTTMLACHHCPFKAYAPSLGEGEHRLATHHCERVTDG